jgi:O-antigen/teichoic acid export membrane protein
LIIPTINWQSLLNDDLKIIVEYNYIMRVAVTAIIGLFIMDIVKIIYAAHGNTAVGNKLQLAGSALSLIGIWFLSVFTIKGQLDLAIMVIAYSPLLVNIFANLYAYSTKFRILRPKISLVKLKNSKDLFNLSIKFFVVQITATIVYASLPFVISRFYGPESVAQYHVANSIFNFPILLISLFTAPITPFVTIEFSKGNSTWIRESLKKTLILAGIVCLGTGLMIIISPWIYQFWLGDKIAVSFNLSIVLGIFSIINILVNPLSTFLNAIGKIDLFVFLAPIEISLFIGGCFLFDYLLNDVTAIILALSITNSLGLILEPLILKKYDLFPKFTY